MNFTRITNSVVLLKVSSKMWNLYSQSINRLNELTVELSRLVVNFADYLIKRIRLQS